MEKKILLGEKVGHSKTYDPAVLYRIERKENREQYGLNEEDLPFTGFDVWTCYEASFLTRNGLPVNGVLKIVYPADGHYMVESKSLKLYLNSLNMEKSGFKDLKTSIDKYTKTIKSDLTALLEIKVEVTFFKIAPRIFSQESNPWEKLEEIGQVESLVFEDFKENPSLLKTKGKLPQLKTWFLTTDTLRSNCKVTNQPDWGDLFLVIKTHLDIDLESLLKYIVSFRGENHFHEEVVEMIYKRLLDAFQTEELMVFAKYTRRGGIDINPIRWSKRVPLFDYSEWSLCNPKILHRKELRQ